MAESRLGKDIQKAIDERIESDRGERKSKAGQQQSAVQSDIDKKKNHEEQAGSWLSSVWKKVTGQ